MILPILYKKTNTGAIQSWEISVIENPDHSSAYDIITTYGQINGKQQTTSDTIFEGKNIGRSNETTVEQQAKADATSKWEKQLKKGYVQNIDDASNGKTDDIIEGGVFPMLAQVFEKHSSKIGYPCYGQPKLDGLRVLAVVKNGEVSLWSRTRKQIRSLPHIEMAIKESINFDTILDGEAYLHEYNNDFEKIASSVRKDKATEGSSLLEYHVYDIVIPGIEFKDRTSLLKNLNLKSPLKLVDTFEVSNPENIYLEFSRMKSMGYEGLMVRNSNSLYEQNKRSYGLQKVKEFDDSEFMIIGAIEGNGKLADAVGAFTCITEDGQEFNVKMSGSTDRLVEYFNDPSSWMHQKLTVQYQGRTAYGIPRFPVGLRIRED